MPGEALQLQVRYMEFGVSVLCVLHVPYAVCGHIEVDNLVQIAVVCT